MAYESAPKRGVVVHYGPRVIETKGGSHGGKGRVKTFVCRFDSADVNADYSVASDLVGVVDPIPAGAHILDVTLKVLTAATGTATVTIGLNDAADSTIDADGLMAAATSIASAVTLAGTGSAIGGVLAADAYPVIAGSATDSAGGEMEVIVTYMV